MVEIGRLDDKASSGLALALGGEREGKDVAASKQHREEAGLPLVTSRGCSAAGLGAS
jgi:hypothetical protein